MKTRIKLENIEQYLFVFLVILTFRTVYISTGSYLRKIIIFSYIALIAFDVLVFFRRKYSKSFLVYFTAYILYFVFFLCLNANSTIFSTMLTYFGTIFPLLLLFYNSKSIKYILELLKKFSNVVFVIALLSLLIYAVGPLFNFIEPTNTISNEWTGKKIEIPSYFNIHFITQKTKVLLKSESIVRNTSIFNEAPMFSLILVLGFSVEVLYGKKNIFRQLVYMCAIISTYSTTGILCIIILYFLKWLLLGKNRRTKLAILPIVGVIVLIPLFIILNKKSNSSSYSIRYDDIMACIKVWNIYPFFGVGFGNTNDIIKFMSQFRMGLTVGLSSSLFSILAEGGIYFLIIFMIPIFNIIRYNYKAENNKALILLLIYIFLFILTIFTNTILSMNFLAIGFLINNIKRNEMNKENVQNETKIICNNAQSFKN